MPISSGMENHCRVSTLVTSLNVRNVTDYPPATQRVTEMRSISTQTPGVQFYPRVCINTAAELDRPWRWTFTRGESVTVFPEFGGYDWFSLSKSQ